MRVALFAVLVPLFLFVAYHVLLVLVSLCVAFFALVFCVVADVA